MAGDWIKVERATLTKPEVTLAAEYLGVSRREMLGILLDFWAWLDATSRYAVVTQVSRKSFEAMLSCAGLSSVLEQVGWVKFDDDKHTMTITNYDRHNGNPAKTRALARDRMQRSRADSVTQDASPEKRREEKILKTLNPIANSAAPNVAEACQVLEFLNLKTGRHFRATPKTIEPIVRRIKEGATVGECKAVVMHRWRMWKDDDKQRDWLRPSTLFSASHFANYLGDVPQAEDLIRGD